jgi:hypothetical protein
MQKPAQLRQPLQAARADVVANTRFVPMNTQGFPRLAYVSRSWWTTFVRCEMRNLPCTAEHATRAASITPPWFGEHVYADTIAIAQNTTNSMRAERRRHRVQRYHGGLTPPAPVLWRERLPARKRFLRCTNARPRERRASARRGCAKHVCADTSAPVRRTADSVCADGCCIRVNSPHGGLTPPALVLWRERLQAKKRFLRCTNARPRERRALARRGGSNAVAIANAFVQQGGRQPAVGV